MRQRRTLVFVGGAALLAAVAWSPRLLTAAQQIGLPQPGEDTRAVSARIVEPVPLPVTGRVEVTTSGALPVTLVDPPPGLNPARAPLDPGRCYALDLTGARLEPVWQVDGVRGDWVHVQRLHGGNGEPVAQWLNTTRLSRVSDPIACP